MNNSTQQEGAIGTEIYTQQQIDYVSGVSDSQLRAHLLHQVRLRDNMERDRDAFEIQLREIRLLHQEAKLSLEQDLAQLINKRSLENETDTPDFILAEFLTTCYKAYYLAVTKKKSHSPSPLSISELKQKFAEHLGEKELNTTDAYAIEFAVKNRNNE